MWLTGLRSRRARPAWPERRARPAWPERPDRPAWPERRARPAWPERRARAAGSDRRARSDAVGVVLGGVAALSYAATVVLGRSLATAGVSSATALTFRFGIAALVLGGILVARRTPLVPPPGERLRLVLLGGVAFATQSTFFFLGLEHGTAAATALVFYAYPAMVALLELALGSSFPLRRLLLAVGLSAAGTVAVLASGNDVAISGTGIVFALAAGAVFAVYLLGSSRLIHRTDAWTQASWVAGAATITSAVRGLATGSLAVPAGEALAVLGYGAFTASAFGLMFVALMRLGATRTAVVMTLEAFFAVILGAAFLGEALAPTQVLGGAAILGAAGLVAVTRSSPGTPAPAGTEVAAVS